MPTEAARSFLKVKLISSTVASKRVGILSTQQNLEKMLKSPVALEGTFSSIRHKTIKLIQKSPLVKPFFFFHLSMCKEADPQLVLAADQEDELS